MNQITVADPAAESHRIVYTNERSKFRRLVMRGVLLELITAGFYRFWLATDMRRHLWSRTSVNSDAVEYAGTGKELLFGFLFAMAILAPLYLSYFLIGIEVERWKTFASAPLFLFFYLFAQFAVYRARRYRLTRTVWRGVRFWMTGSGWSYAWRAALWGLLFALTLGIALPWKQAALERFKMRHTSYGDLPARFDGTGWELFKRGWWLWLLVLLVVICIGLGMSLPLAERGDLVVANAKASKETMDAKVAIAVSFAVAGYLLFAVGYPFVHAIYKAIEWRWWLSAMRFGDVSFSSDLKRRALIGLYWKVIGWGVLFILSLTVLFLIIGGVFGLVMALKSGGMPEEELSRAFDHNMAVTIAIIVGYVAVTLALGIVVRIYLMHDLWKRVTESVTVHNLAAANNVKAQGKLVGALGEGLADSLDVAGF